MIATGDGGRTWHSVPLPPGPVFGGAAHFITPLQGWCQDLRVAANAGTREIPTAMWWTDDGGATWQERWRVDAQHPSAAGVTVEGAKYVLGFRDADHGWLGVNRGIVGRLLATADGGRTWTPVDLPVRQPAVPAGLDFLPDGAIELQERTAVGLVVLSSRDGSVWDGPRTVPLGSPGDDGEDNRVSFTDATHWALVGGRVLHVTADAGRTWWDVVATLPAGISVLRDVWLFPGGKGWATAENTSARRRVLPTADGGRHWALANPAP